MSPIWGSPSTEGSFLGRSFPKIEGETLSGVSMELPHKKATLLLIGFDRNCVPQVREWISTIRKEKLLPHFVDLYTLPVLGDSWQAKLFRPITLEMIRKQVPKKEHAAVYIAKGVHKKLKEFFCKKESGDETLYLVLLDEKGTIRWQFDGKLNQQAKQALKKASFNLKQ